MADTPRTLAQLIGTYFADQHIRGVGQQQIRDLIMSFVPTIVDVKPTADTNVGIATVDITGASATFNIPAVGAYIDLDVQWELDGNVSVAAGDAIFGYFYLDGVQLNTNGPLRFTFRAAADRVLVAGPRIIYGPLAAGSHTVKLTIIRFGGTGTMICRATGTRLFVTVLPTAFNSNITPDASP